MKNPNWFHRNLNLSSCLGSLIPAFKSPQSGYFSSWYFPLVSDIDKWGWLLLASWALSHSPHLLSASILISDSGIRIVLAGTVSSCSQLCPGQACQSVRLYSMVGQSIQKTEGEDVPGDCLVFASSDKWIFFPFKWWKGREKYQYQLCVG